MHFLIALSSCSAFKGSKSVLIKSVVSCHRDSASSRRVGGIFNGDFSDESDGERAWKVRPCSIRGSSGSLIAEPYPAGLREGFTELDIAEVDTDALATTNCALRIIHRHLPGGSTKLRTAGQVCYHRLIAFYILKRWQSLADIAFPCSTAWLLYLGNHKQGAPMSRRL